MPFPGEVQERMHRCHVAAMALFAMPTNAIDSCTMHGHDLRLAHLGGGMQHPGSMMESPAITAAVGLEGVGQTP